MADINVTVKVDTSQLDALDGKLKKGYTLNVNGVSGTSSDVENLNRNVSDTTRNVSNLGTAFVSKVKWGLIQSTIQGVGSAFKKAVNNMKEVDTQLTNIAKVTGQQIEQLGSLADKAYSTASKYGVSAGQYMEAVYEYTKAGFKDNADAMGELSTKAMLVGDTTAAIADKFLIAGNAAFKMNGDISKLSMMVDQADYINNNYATTLDKIAEGFPRVASVASMAGMTAEETMAALGTITATTQETASRASTALRALIINILGDTNTEIEDGITATESSIQGLRDALQQYAPDVVAAADATGKLINPMKALESLAKAYKNGLLDEKGLFKIETALGGKLRTNQLDALLKNFDTYKEMLSGMGSAAGTADQEISTMLQSWESKAAILENTWTEFVSKSLNSDMFKGLIDGGTKLLNLLGDLKTAIVLLGGTIASVKLAKIASSVQSNAEGLISTVRNVSLSAAAAAIGAFTAIYTTVTMVMNHLREQQKEVISSLQEEASNASSRAQAAHDEISNIEALYNAYNTLRENYANGAASSAELESASQQLADALGIETTAVDALNAAYERVIYNKRLDMQADAELSLLKAKQAYQESLNPYGLTEGQFDFVQGFVGIPQFQALVAAQRQMMEFAKSEDNIDDLVRVYKAKKDYVEMYDEAAKGDVDYFKNLEQNHKIAYDQYVAAKEYINANSAMMEGIITAQELLDSVQEMSENAADTAENAADSIAEGFEAVQSAADGATAAVKRYQGALEEGQAVEDAYKTVAQAYQAFAEDWDKGMRNSANINAFIEMMNDDETILAARKAGIDLGELYASEFWRGVFTYTDDDGKIQFTKGEDRGAEFIKQLYFGEGLDSLGIEHEIDDLGNAILRKNHEIIATIEKDSKTGGYHYLIDDLGTLAEALNLPLDMILTLVGAANSWNGEMKTTKEEAQYIADQFGALKQDGETVSVEKMVKSAHEAGESVKDLLADIDKLKSAEGITLTIDNEEEIIALIEKIYSGGETEENKYLSDTETKLERINDKAQKAYEKFMQFGNIDLANRQVKYNDDGSYSTVLGGSEGFAIGDQVIEIAFSPLLQTDSGTPIELTADEVREYIQGLLDEASADGEWSIDEILALDAGESGKKLIAEISDYVEDAGNKARTTAEEMHNISEQFADMDPNTENLAEVNEQISALSAYVEYLQSNDEIDLDFKDEQVKNANALIDVLQQKSDATKEEIQDALQKITALQEHIENINSGTLYPELGEEQIANAEREIERLQEKISNLSGLDLNTVKAQTALEETNKGIDQTTKKAKDATANKYEFKFTSNTSQAETDLDRFTLKIEEKTRSPYVFQFVTQETTTTSSKSRKAGIQELASGTKHARGGATLLNERGPEIIIEDGVARIAGGGKPVISVVQKDATVLNAHDTKRLLQGEGIDALGGGAEGTTPDNWWEKPDSSAPTTNNPGQGNNGTTAQTSAGGNGAQAQLDALKESVELYKSWLKVAEAKEVSDKKQAEIQQKIADAIKEAADYGKEHGLITAKEYNELYAEYYETLKKVDELQLSLLGKTTSKYKSQLDLLESQDASTKKLIQKERQIRDALQAEIDLMIKQKASQEEINAKKKEQLELDKKIKEQEQGLYKNLKAAVENKLDKINKQRDAELEKLKKKYDQTEKQNELEAKQLAVEEARERWRNAKAQKTVRVYNASTGRWEWQANAKDVAAAKKELDSAKENLQDYKRKQQYNADVEAINEKYDAQAARWRKVLDQLEEPAMSLAKALKQIEKNGTKAMKSTIKALNKLLRPMGYHIDTSKLYDSGGVLHGTGGIKGTSSDEMILPPDITKAMLTPTSTQLFQKRLSELRSLYGATAGVASANSTSVGEQINGGTFYQYGDVVLTEAQARSTTIYDLARMARGLKSYASVGR